MNTVGPLTVGVGTKVAVAVGVAVVVISCARTALCPLHDKVSNDASAIETDCCRVMPAATILFTLENIANNLVRG